MSIERNRLRAALLIIRFQSGDDSAFEELFLHRCNLVRSTVCHWTGDRGSVVDDVCQQVWLAVFKALPTLKQPMAFDAWIGRIIRAEVAAMLRRRQRIAVPLDSIAEPEDVLRPNEEPPDWRSLENALQHLDQQAVKLLRMRFWQGRSYEQIAVELDIPIGTVRSRLHYAKKTLKNHLSSGESYDG